MLDVDSKDVTSGMSCPPQEFVSPETLERINKCLEPNGLFILNLVCRNVLCFTKIKFLYFKDN
jgi:hypothetical protein